MSWIPRTWRHLRRSWHRQSKIERTVFGGILVVAVLAVGLVAFVAGSELFFDLFFKALLGH
jgi:hypothetical protein